MKHDNSDIKQEVSGVVEKSYKISVDSVEFISVGEESYSYLITSGKNEYFAKYCDKSYITKNIDAANKVLLTLKHLDFVVPPIDVNGQTSFDVLEGRMYVYPFIKGRVIRIGNEKWDSNFVKRMVDIMIQIHASASLINFKLSEEDFSNKFSQRFNELLNFIKNHGDLNKKALKLLKDNESLIRKVIRRHTELGNKYKNMPKDFVLTHGDITGLNIIDTGEQLKLVDWDGVMLAPPERDINFFSSNPNFSVDEYLKRTGRNEYVPELGNYYGQQWSLDSIVGNLETLLYGEVKVVDDTEYIEEIKEYLGFFK